MFERRYSGMRGARDFPMGRREPMPIPPLMRGGGGNNGGPGSMRGNYDPMFSRRSPPRNNNGGGMNRFGLVFLGKSISPVFEMVS